MAEQLVRVARKKLCPDQSSLASEVPIDCFSVLDALPDQAAVVDHAGVIIRTNKAWRDFSAANGGTPDQTGQGINYLSVCCSEEEQVVHTSAQLRELLAGEREVLSLEYPCHSPQQQRWFLMRAQRLRGGALITHTDITQRKLAELQAERLASHDPLTLTLNRRGFSHRLAAEMSRVRRRGGTVSAILIDIDDFKSINSHFGHAVGDIVLVEVARRFCDLLRAEDLLARIGGDEFLFRWWSGFGWRSRPPRSSAERTDRSPSPAAPRWLSWARSASKSTRSCGRAAGGWLAPRAAGRTGPPGRAACWVGPIGKRWTPRSSFGSRSSE